jgi:hypothetical protein
MAANDSWKTQPRDANGHFVVGPKVNKKVQQKPSSKKPKPAPKAIVESEKKKLVNHFAICLDASGSMMGIREHAVAAFNSNVKAIRENSEKQGQESTVTFVTFGERSLVVEKFFAHPVTSLKELTAANYRPDGMTPLLDAVGKTINRLRSIPDSLETSYVVMVITDGCENHSHSFTQINGKLEKLMQQVTSTDRWTFVFMVPPGAKANLCKQFGIPEGNVQEWEATAQGMATASASLNSGVAGYYAVRSLGQTSSKTFLTTDLSKVTDTDLKKLVDVRSKAKIWSVEKECVIKDFVESHGEVYLTGNAFYQLTKPETIQPQKQIAIMKKGEKAIYTGYEARRLLGLPDNQDARVKPGNHMNYDIFTQSTSVNRKLVRGTKLIYLRQN